MTNVPDAVKQEPFHYFSIHGFVDDDQCIAIVDAGLIMSTFQDRKLCAIHVYAVIREQETDIRILRDFAVGGEEVQIAHRGMALSKSKVDGALFWLQKGVLSGFLVITKQDILAVETDDRAVRRRFFARFEVVIQEMGSNVLDHRGPPWIF